MGLFDKKYCDICGEKIGLLGNRKLEDGNLCKNCAKKLSPWFNERRHSSVSDIQEQLAYREENKKKVANFHVTRRIGESRNVLFDDTNRWLTVTNDSSPQVSTNPDIVDYAALTGCNFDIKESRNEIYRETPDGKRVSYQPPRYEYLYVFNMQINVNTPYFDEMEFCLNGGTVRYRPEPTMQISLFGHSLTNNGVNPENCPDYRKYRAMGQAICEEIERARNLSAAAPTAQPAAAPAAPATTAATAWNCPNCGATNVGKFCESCGSAMPAANTCTGCGWTPAVGQSLPKFCPECGKPLR